MSFGSGFGSGGGFGANKNTNTGFGFGSNNTGGGFGQQNTSSGFGSTANNTGGTGFGSTPSIFGSGGSGFGSTPSFGGTTANNPSTGGGLFGNTSNNNTSSAFGGFGANSNNNASNTTSGGLFGNTNRAGFGNNTGTGLFGTSGNTTSASAFGSTANNSNSLFGSAPASTALGQPVPESQGTAAPQFQAYTEKDTPQGNATNQFQTITFMQPYQKYSLEELRIGDYNQGRRFGNAAGQAGGFGASSFGGFGNNNTSNTSSNLFGQQSQAPAFGTNTSTASNTFGGGTNTTGTGFGLFGNANNQQSGGAFGTSNNNPTGFGNQQQGGAFGGSTGGGLFGTTQTTKAPGLTFGTGTTNNASGGLFGNTNQGTSTGFGAQNNTGGGGLFGSLGQNNTFGTTTSSAPNSTPFGTATTNNTTGGLFGNLGQSNQQSTGGLFGNTNTAASGSLFGNKPATSTGSNAFGSANPSGGGLFGNLSNNNTNQSQPNQGTGLFGTTSNTGASGGLFGNLSNNNPAQNNNSQSTGIFGNVGQSQNQNANQPGGLFGNQNSNASSNFMNNSMLNNSQQANALQPPQAYIASMLDRNPYGSASIFNGLPPPPQTSPGPIATPIFIGSTQKKPAPLPHHKLGSGMGSRFMTPQKRGYGFSYSTYGTPSSASSVASTPGAYGNSLLGSSIGRNLGKSYSMSNLRRTYDGETESILSPGAFSSTNTRHSGSGGLKRLTIDRSLRTDLFGNQALAALPSPQPTPQPNATPSLKKKVSFGSTTLNDNGSSSTPVGDYGQNPLASGNDADNLKGQSSSSRLPAPVSTPHDSQSSGPTTRNDGRSSSTRTNGHVNGTQSQNVKGNELAIVHEDESPTPIGPTRSSKSIVPGDGRDPVPGDYYMRPSRDELRKFTKTQLKQVSNFVLGRENCGFVTFDRPVDLTSLEIDHIFPNLAQMDIRSLTIYPDTPHKPGPGQGLNVPATITLPNSWPRLRDKITPSMEKSGPRFEKHVARLKQVKGTEFIRYDKENGIWIFKVQHFSTYGLDYDEGDEDEGLGESRLSTLPDSPTPTSRTPKGRNTPIPPSALVQSSTLSDTLASGSSSYDSSLEDTFEYRKSQPFPGAFDQSHSTHDTETQMEELQDDEMSFLASARP